jgi:F-type H+-transporting ATPase subunit b
MEQTFQALGNILLKAIPSVFFLLILHFYLKAMLFAPLVKAMKHRDELTRGARKAAEESLAKAEQKAKEYEAKLQDAHNEVYRQNEETRKQWLADQAAHLASAKASAEATMKAATESIAVEAAAARQGLQESSTAIANQIAQAILGTKA